MNLSLLPKPEEFFVEALRRLGRWLRNAVIEHRLGSSPEELARVETSSGEGDTIYQIDRASDETLIRGIEAEIARECRCAVVAEGLSGPEGLMLGGAKAKALGPGVRLLVDPIDGTRGLMTDKRSAWVLCAVAPDLGPKTTLADVVVAVQTEIPTRRQWRSDQLWAVRGRGAQGEWEHLVTGEGDWRGPITIRPSRAKGLEHGFASFARFFPGAREVLAEIEEEVIRRVVGPPPEGRALVFEDQYISTGGQLYELIMGHDRLVADLRPLITPILRSRGLPPSLTCHPYDLATVLIAQEAGVVVTDERGGLIRYPLDTTTNCCWIGYANRTIQKAVEPVIRAVLEERKMI